MTTEEAVSLAEAGAHGVEVYNHSCFVGSARSSGIATVDQLLNDGYRMSLTATDDSYRFRMMPLAVGLRLLPQA